MADKTLEVLLKFGLDASKAKEAQRALTDLEKSADKARQGFQRMRESAEQMGQVGMRIGVLGAAIAGPLVASMVKYNQQVGMAEGASARWFMANQKIEQSQLKIGRATSQILAPAIEAAADQAERLAGFLADNPDVLKATLGIGGTLAAGGAALTLAAQVKGAMATLGMLGAGGGLALAGGAISGAMGGINAAGGVGSTMYGPALAGKTMGAAGSAGLVATIGSVLAVAAVVAAAAVATDAILTKLNIGEEGGLGQKWKRAKQVWAAPVALTGGLVAKGLDAVGLKDAGSAVRDFTVGVLKASGTLDDVAVAAQSDADRINKLILSDQQVGAYQGYQAAGAERTTQYQSQRGQIGADYATNVNTLTEQKTEDDMQIWQDYFNQSGQLLADYTKRQKEMDKDRAKTQARDLRDFAKSQKESETSYYAQRADRARSFGAEVEQAEADHQKAMRRMSEDYQMGMEDAIAGRDAISALQQTRQYEVNRSRAEEDYQDQAGQRSEAFAKELADMESGYKAQRDTAIEALAQRQSDEAEDWRLRQEADKAQLDEQLTKLEDAKTEQLAKLDETHKAELDKLEAQKTAVLAKLDETYAAENDKAAKNFRDMLGKMGLLNGPEQESYLKEFAAAGDGLRAAILSGFTGAPVKPYQKTEKNMASGGYAGFGQATLGERGAEFVLNAATTRAAEGALGRALSQDALLAGLASGRSGGARGGMSITQNLTFNGTQNTEDVRRVVREETERALNEFVAEAER